MFAKTEPYYPNFSIAEALDSSPKMTDIRSRIDEGEIIIFRNFISQDKITNLKNYLHTIQQSCLPEFVPIEEGAKNNYRINFEDPRSPIPAFFHVWSFFTWNQDLFNLYDTYRDVYRLRNTIAGLADDTFINGQSAYDCAARLSVQFYPSGKGFFSAHEDPYDVHQIVVPIMAMSKKGDDFHGGGNFVRTSENSVIDTEDLVSPGDIVLFNSLCEHGVALVDEDLDFDPLAKSGRWMMLFAVNKTANNKQIKDAVLKK